MTEEQAAELLALLRQMAVDVAEFKKLAEYAKKNGVPVFTLPEDLV